MAKFQLHHMEIHPTENGGHVVEHHFKSMPSKGRDGIGMSYQEPQKHSFGADEHAKMMEHVHESLGLKNEPEEDRKSEAGAEKDSDY